MKKGIKIILLLMLSLIMVGCYSGEDDSESNANIPTNNKLDISGEWYSNNYSMLEQNVATNDEIRKIQENKLSFGSSFLEIGNKRVDGISYKLKVVKSDYIISYEAKYSIEDIGCSGQEFKVYSIENDNNIIGEIIYISDDESYFYYKGILFNIKREGDISNFNEDEDLVSENQDDNFSITDVSQGLCLGLKTESNKDSAGNYKREEYRTIWISTNKGSLQSIKQRENIIVPRGTGIWKIVPRIYEDNSRNIYYEYFSAMSIEKEEKGNDIDVDKISDGNVVKKSIKFVGNDYLSMEVSTNEKFSESPAYQVLPIDNLYTNSGVSIGDILGQESKSIFKQNYQNTYQDIDIDDKDKLYEKINYCNYTLIRSNGKWVLQGRISPVLPEGRTYDYLLNIKANKALVKYDTLIIPWKVLKGSIPMLSDAFISPKGSLAIIVTDKKLEIYRVSNGKLEQNPIKIIQLKDNEKVIMSEWCEGDYVEKWAKAFSEHSSIIE